MLPMPGVHGRCRSADDATLSRAHTEARMKISPPITEQTPDSPAMSVLWTDSVLLLSVGSDRLPTLQTQLTHTSTSLVRRLASKD